MSQLVIVILIAIVVIAYVLQGVQGNWSELVIVIVFAILGLAAQAAKKHKWLEWFLRVVVFITFIAEVLYLVFPPEGERLTPWYYWINTTSCAATGLILFMLMRKLLAKVLGVINSLITGGLVIRLLRRRGGAAVPLISDPVFVAHSIPHMNGAFLYICTMNYLLTQMNPGLDMKWPSMPIPIPVDLPSLFSYNWFGLILLSFCGAGIFVARKPREVLARLGLTKITKMQFGIGLSLIVMSFLYDLVWSLYTHNTSGDLATKLSNYNSGTFGVVGGLTPSVILALATAVCAGMGRRL